MTMNNILPKEHYLSPLNGDWSRVVNNEYITQLWSAMIAIPDFELLDYPRPEVLKRACKKNNKKFGKGLFSEEVCR